jgi:molybdate transport system ATP-binding protein
VATGGGLTLEADLGVVVGDLDLELSLAVEPGEVVALLGPNGSGKTTALRAIAGLVPLRRGRIVLDGRVLDDAASTWVPTERRGVGVVFQDHLLFPHLSVLENVAFGLRAGGMRREAARDRARAALDLVGIAVDVDRRPDTLSGGQAQRVALARALVTEPRVLLLDEPLAALDAQVRGAVRSELRRTLARFDGIRLLVTHDPVDAMVLADRLVVVEAGRVTQSGTPEDVSRHPRSAYVADLLDTNLLRGRADGRFVRVAAELVLESATEADGDVYVALPPRAVAVHLDRPQGSPRNAWATTVEAVEGRGVTVRLHLAGPVPVVAEVTAASARELGLDPGTRVWAAVKATETSVYPLA